MSLATISPELLLTIADHVIDIADLSALQRTCRDVHKLLGRYIFRRDAKNGSTALIWAAERDNKKLLVKSIKHGGNVHQLKPLEKSYRESRFKWVQSQIISHSLYMCLNKENDDVTHGLTTLQLAVFHKHAAVVKLLIKHGADVEGRYTEITGGGRPLHFACGRGAVRIVKMLLDKGADIEGLDSENRTPLHWAIRFSEHGRLPKTKAETVRLLLDRGADFAARDGKGRSARDRAQCCPDKVVQMMGSSGVHNTVALHEVRCPAKVIQQKTLVQEEQKEREETEKKKEPVCRILKKAAVVDDNMDWDKIRKSALESTQEKPRKARKKAKGKKGKKTMVAVNWQQPEEKSQKQTQLAASKTADPSFPPLAAAPARGDKATQVQKSHNLKTGNITTSIITPVSSSLKNNPKPANGTLLSGPGFQASGKKLEQGAVWGVVKIKADGRTSRNCTHPSIRLIKRKGKAACSSCCRVVKQTCQCPDCDTVMCSACITEKQGR
ncbi:hypothetical protein AJ80_06245 [Polytolypa hystricis UAMH7299]|uniref:Uncharacterized protein n=1 Tax=Polytolypa hystricis (strain UAMH7299) TaxID=1447883 RepID=A0A2B7XPB1_POLH7|nr:hypothetical protein AJ80_06245 [Polytolypa hystricis UAMH7299]